MVLKTASVAMAVYNGEKYLPDQIDSILEQLYDDDELVISYDKSTDNTRAIIEQYAQQDPRVKIIDNDTPGIVGNFNNAIAHTTKDVIFISDQDDVWVPGKRDIMVGALNESNADLAFHNAVHVDEHEQVISRPQFEEFGIRKGFIRNFAKPRWSGCCMAFPSRTKRLIMPMPASVINYDNWISTVCELYGNVVLVDDILLHHRLHGENATVQRRPILVVAQQRFNLMRALVKKAWDLRS